MATPLPSPPQGNSPTPASIAALIRGTVESDEAAVALCAKALNILQSNSLEDAHKRVSILGLGGEEDGAAAAGEPRSIEVASPPLPPRSEKGASGATTTWSEVVLHRPAFMAYSFLRVPPPCCPRVNEGTEGALASYPTQADAGTARLAEPSPEIIVLITVRDRYGDYRGCIAKDGQCFNNTGHTTGFINWADNMAGSAEEDYLGCCKDQLSGDEICVEDSLDEVCGFAHLGHALIQDANKNMVAEVKRDGQVHSSAGSTLGFFEPFRFGDMRAISLYVMLVDPGMLSRDEA